jgi:hypothetical protein
MTTKDPTSGGDTAARGPRRRVITGWLPCEAQWWADIADALMASGQAWPDAAVRMDLRWWDDVSRMTGADVRPGRAALCRRWRWSDWQARAMMADRSAWADPAKPDQRPSLQSASSFPPASLQLPSSPPPEHLQVSGAKRRDDKGAPPASLQLPSSFPPASLQSASSPPPHARKTQNTDTATDTGTDTETEPAGAGQLALIGQAVTESPRKPTAADRERAAAEDLLARLDAMRLERHAGGRALRVETWLPRMRRALRQQSAQEWIDGWTWVLRSPEAAWHRGEERGSPDRTRDLAMLLAHPEYAARRTWRGLEGPHGHDIEARPAEAVPEPVPALTPYQVAQAEREAREKRENAELIAKRDAERAEFFRARGIVLPF